jgi:hypothetical protein
MKRLLTVVALVSAACSSSATASTTTIATTTSSGTSASNGTTTTQPVVSVEARFALGTVVFGEQGRIEVVNMGPQAANVHGEWIAIHPFYLELPSAIVEVGDHVTIGFDEVATPEALVHASGLLPAPTADGGEIGLYENGSFGDPSSIVDYVEWGESGHFRSTVAVAAGVWAEDRVVTTSGDEGGLIPNAGAAPQLLDADLAPLPTEG